MKRLFVLAAALLALTVALSACGDSTEPVNETTTQTESEASVTTEPSSDEEGETAETIAAQPAAADLAGLAERMLSDNGITDYVPVSADALASVYGIDPGQIVSAVGYNASANGAFPQEIVLIQAADEAAVQEIQDRLSSRLDSIAEQAASYDPESQALAETCAVVTQGEYVGLFFSEHYDALVAAFQNGLS